MSSGDDFWTDAQLAKALQVTQRTTLRWRRDGGGPPFVRIGKHRILYRRASVEQWIDGRTYPHMAAEAAATTN